MKYFRERAVVLILCLPVSGAVTESARDIVARSMQNGKGGWTRARDYTFLQRVEERKLDDKNKVTSVETKTYDVSILFGKPYSKLIQRNDKPLAEKEKKQEEEKRDKEVAKRQKENSNGQKPPDKDAEEQRRMAKEVPEAYNFTLVGQEQIAGRPVYVIQAEPRPEYRPHDTQTKVLPKLHGKLWIDVSDYQWVRVEAQVIAPVNFGLFLARLAPGARIEARQERVNGEVWLPQQTTVRFDARLALVKRMNEEVVVTFKDYKKFQSETKILPASGDSQ